VLEDSNLLLCDVVSGGEFLLTFREILLLHFFELHKNEEASNLLRNVGCNLPFDKYEVVFKIFHLSVEY
jgi:hypothetical protein